MKPLKYAAFVFIEQSNDGDCCVLFLVSLDACLFECAIKMKALLASFYAAEQTLGFIIFAFSAFFGFVCFRD